MTDSLFYTRCGDDGYTGLLGPERVPKYDLRPEAYGTVDEAQAALGVARAAGISSRTAGIVRAVQRRLHSLMAELASAGDADSPFAGSITTADVSQLEAWIAELEASVEMPRGFVLPGDSPVGAALHVARTIVRRAERHSVQLAHQGLLQNGQVVRYLNRLSSLLFVLAIVEDRAITGSGPTLTRQRKSDPE